MKTNLADKVLLNQYHVDTLVTYTSAIERIRSAQLILLEPDRRLFNSAVPVSMAGVTLNALPKDSRQRYRSVNEVYEALCSSLNVNPVLIPDRLSGM
jgi:hypothetical protein